MGWLSTVFGSAGEKIVDKVAAVVDDLTLSKEEKESFNIQMQRLVLDQFRAVEESVQARLQAVQGIITAEMASGDNFTKRARPTVVYVGLALFILQVLAQMFVGIPPITIPSDFTYAWAGIVGVWSIGRSFEKTVEPNRVSQKITGSSKKIDLTNLLN